MGEEREALREKRRYMRGNPQRHRNRSSLEVKSGKVEGHRETFLKETDIEKGDSNCDQRKQARERV